MAFEPALDALRSRGISLILDFWPSLPPRWTSGLDPRRRFPTVFATEKRLLMARVAIMSKATRIPSFVRLLVEV